MNDIYKNIEECNPNKKRKILIVFDDMITNMLKLSELFIRGRKLNISFVFITVSYFAVPKYITLSSTHYLIMKIPNKGELQKIAFKHSLDIAFKDFISLYKKRTAKPYSFLVIDTILASNNPSHFRKNLLEII